MKPNLPKPLQVVYHAGVAFIVLWFVSAYVVFWTLARLTGIQRQP